MARQIGSGYKGIGEPIIQRDIWQAENHSALAAAWFQRMSDLGLPKNYNLQAEREASRVRLFCCVSFNGELGIKWNYSTFSFKTERKKTSPPHVGRSTSILSKVILQMSAPYANVWYANGVNFQFSYLKTTRGGELRELVTVPGPQQTYIWNINADVACKGF